MLGLTINNIDLSNYGARLLSKKIENAIIETTDDWLSKALSPILLKQQTKYKVITLEIFIKGTDINDAYLKMSNLTSAMKVATLKFDDLSFYYDCFFEQVNYDKSSITKNINVKYTLNSGYAYMPAITETLNHVSSKVISVQGNLPTQAIVIVTAPIDTISITLTGLGEDPIIIKNLKANMPVIIDGESCTVLQSGVNKFDDTDMWQYPILQPGANTITSSTANCVIQMQYKPRWI